MAVIGISGSYGGLNIGDEAILTSMLTSLRAARPDARDEFVVFSRNADHTRAHHDVDRVIPSRELSRDQVKPEIERLDLFLLGGGGILYDSEARIYARDVCMAQERRIPTFAYDVGAGPLDEPEDPKRVRTTLDGMTSITVRDEVSKRVLEHIGVQRPIEVTADPALLLEADSVPPDVRCGQGPGGKRHVVGLWVREPGRAASDLDQVWGGRADQQRILRERAPVLRKRAQRTVDLALQTLSDQKET